MLSREESEVMRAVCGMCGGRGCCLVSPAELLGVLPSQKKFSPERLDKILRSLELDDCFELIRSERKGEKMYVITLHPNGAAYPRARQQVRRGIAFRILLSAAGAVVTFLVGLLLKAIFS